MVNFDSKVDIQNILVSYVFWTAEQKISDFCLRTFCCKRSNILLLLHIKLWAYEYNDYRKTKIWNISWTSNGTAFKCEKFILSLNAFELES